MNMKGIASEETIDKQQVEIQKLLADGVKEQHRSIFFEYIAIVSACASLIAFFMGCINLTANSINLPAKVERSVK